MNQLQTFWALIRRDWAVFLSESQDRLINGLLWIASVIVVFEYIMPQAGLKGYGVFIAISSIATYGMWSVMDNACDMIADLENERSITYYLTLPVPQWMIFARIGISNAIQVVFMSLLFIPIMKICLWNQFVLSQVNWVQFVVIFILGSIFYGFFSLFLASSIKNFKTIENVWTRILWPMWMLGCYNFKWIFLYDISPQLAYITCINPMVFIMEGTRATVLGQEGSLPFWLCSIAILGFTALFGTIGTLRLKKRLDCL